MVLQQKVTVTRNSNGSADLRPAEGEANPLGIDRVELHTTTGLALGQLENGKDYQITIDTVDTQAVLDDGTRATARVNAPLT
jgi:hypothetical protein